MSEKFISPDVKLCFTFWSLIKPDVFYGRAYFILNDFRNLELNLHLYVACVWTMRSWWENEQNVSLCWIVVNTEDSVVSHVWIIEISNFKDVLLHWFPVNIAFFNTNQCTNLPIEKKCCNYTSSSGRLPVTVNTLLSTTSRYSCRIDSLNTCIRG